MANDTPQTPPAFQGWDKLFIKQGEPIPAGWTNMSAAEPTPEPKTQTMLTNDGKQSGEVPLHRVMDAIKAGFHLAVEMIAPDGTHGWVPYHRTAEAQEQGFKHAK